MAKNNFFLVILILGIFSLLMFPESGKAQSDEFNVNYVAPGYMAKDFVTLQVNTAALDFDADGNIYTTNGDIGSGNRTVSIWKYLAPDYTERDEFVSYETEATGINGLAFDEEGNLFVTEFDRNLSDDTLDNGYIRKISSALDVGIPISMFYYADNQEVYFRPTGVTAIGDGHLYFPGRKWSDTDFGNLYEIDSFDDYLPPPAVIRDGVVLTALTMNAWGDFYVGSPDNSIYTRDPISDSFIKVASFNQYVEELSFWQGNIYALEARDGTDDTEASIVELSIGGIDIKPGTFPNSFNQNEHGAIPVAIFGGPTIHVEDMVVESLSLQGLAVKIAGKSLKTLSHTEDVNEDGFLDLVVQFQDGDGWTEPGNGYAFIDGELTDGSRIWAGDSICIIPEVE